MGNLQEITAIPIDERFRNESFCITSAKQQPPIDDELPQRFSLFGDAEPGELKAQLPFHFWGRWAEEQYNGSTQYKFYFDSSAPIQPHGKAGIVKYLQQARHVGPATAYTLWDEFEGDAVKVLREEPERASEAVAGGKRFSPQKAREAAEDLERLKVAEDLTIQLYDLFDGRGFGKACVKQALKRWGAKAHEFLTRNPYLSYALRGVGWSKADRFYLDLGKDPNELKRQALCLAYAVEKDSSKNGHIWTTWETGLEFMKASIGAEVDQDKLNPEKALTLAVRGKVLRTRTDEHGQLWAADAKRADAEEYCCRRIVEMMTQ